MTFFMTIGQLVTLNMRRSTTMITLHAIYIADQFVNICDSIWNIREIGLYTRSSFEINLRVFSEKFN